jgi:DNA-binding NtrC family response regulator
MPKVEGVAYGKHSNVNLGAESPRISGALMSGYTAFATKLRSESAARFGTQRSLELMGMSTAMIALQNRIRKIATFDEPVLITGESGVGKELVARALYLLGPRAQGPFQSVNCPQLQDGSLSVSELFGHNRGSFTGAVGDRAGYFEAAEGGVVFLDEVADLPLSAQAMLLRALAVGEFKRVGSNSPRNMDIRLIAATNRSLNQLMEREQFRNDLFFRLRQFTLEVPPLREREDDWRLLIDARLAKAAQRSGVIKTMSADALRLLEQYSWPGNCRELNSVVVMGYAMSDGISIGPADFDELLHRAPLAAVNDCQQLFDSLIQGQTNFWDAVHEPFMARDLNRGQVRALIEQGLRMTNGCYKNLLLEFGLDKSHYQRFMDFLRHNQLKPKLSVRTRVINHLV